MTSIFIFLLTQLRSPIFFPAFPSKLVAKSLKQQNLSFYPLFPLPFQDRLAANNLDFVTRSESFHLIALSPSHNKSPLFPPTHIKHSSKCKCKCKHHSCISKLPSKAKQSSTQQNNFKDDKTDSLLPLNFTCISLPLHHNFRPASRSSGPASKCSSTACHFASSSACQGPSPSPICEGPTNTERCP